MPFLPSPAGRLTALLATCLLINAPIGLVAQDQATDKKAKPAKAAKQAGKRQRPADALHESRQKLKELVPFRADVVETIVVRGKRFRATGKYMQGKGNKLRLEFDLEVGRTKGSLVQVCDGTVLFTQQKIGVVVQATQRNVPRILKEMKQLSGGTAPRPGQFEADLGLGGLDALLGSLERTMSFNKRREQTFQDRPFIIIEGTWNATFLEAITDDDQVQGEGLPEYVPDRVRIYIDKATRFPHRIVYLKKVTNRQVLRPMVSLEFRNVQVKAPLPDASFAFKPASGVRVQDVTDDYIRQIRQAQSRGAATGEGTGQTGRPPPAGQPRSR